MVCMPTSGASKPTSRRQVDVALVTRQVSIGSNAMLVAEVGVKVSVRGYCVSEATEEILFWMRHVVEMTMSSPGLTSMFSVVVPSAPTASELVTALASILFTDQVASPG